jgi:hypothetical protein
LACATTGCAQLLGDFDESPEAGDGDGSMEAGLGSDAGAGLDAAADSNDARATGDATLRDSDDGASSDADATLPDSGDAAHAGVDGAVDGRAEGGTGGNDAASSDAEGGAPDGPAPCNATSCPTGCCSDNQCVTSETTSACGTGGAACVQCPQGVACNAGTGLCLGCTGPTQISVALTGSTPMTGDAFGTSVAASGSTVLVGAPGSSMGAGAAYTFTGSGSSWAAQSTLFPGVGTTTYGSAVALSGTTAAVAGQANGTTPTVYVFDQVGTGWFFQASIAPTTSGELFGQELAMDGSTIVVGGLSNASVYVGSGSSWTLQGSLTPSDFVAGSGFFFGTAVAISGDTIVLEAEPTDTSGESAHWLYVFTRSGSTWSQQGPKLVPTGLVDNNNPHFNFNVGVAGDTIVLATNTNGAYVFTRSAGTWTQTQLIPPGDGNFGSAIAVGAHRTMIGSASFSGGTGLAYLFGESGGVLSAGPQYSDTTGFGVVNGDGFGSPIAMSGPVTIVGAPGTSMGQAGAAGAAYLYSCSP